MTRIFFALAGLSVLLLCSNIVLGLYIGDYNAEYASYSQVGMQVYEDYGQRIEDLKRQRPRPVEEIERLQREKVALEEKSEAEFLPIRNRAFVHMMFGIVAALVTLLVNCICVTYFIGTSRWIREVVETYGFDKSLIGQGNIIKRRTFPWALVGMFTVLGIIALGQAANPGIIREGTAAWVTPHMLGAMLGTALITFAYYRQANSIAENYKLIEQIAAQVDEVRREKGLAEEEEAPPPIKPTFSDTVTG